MYSRMINSKEVRISNRDYKKLLKRFDKNNFEESYEVYSNHNVAMVNDVPCALCKTFRNNKYKFRGCGKCPFAVFQTGCSGCIVVLDGFMDLSYLSMDMDTVIYNPKYESAALTVLKMITNFLKSFEKE